MREAAAVEFFMVLLSQKRIWFVIEKLFSFRFSVILIDSSLLIFPLATLLLKAVECV